MSRARPRRFHADASSSSDDLCNARADEVLQTLIDAQDVLGLLQDLRESATPDSVCLMTPRRGTVDDMSVFRRGYKGSKPEGALRLGCVVGGYRPSPCCRRTSGNAERHLIRASAIDHRSE